jgi:hypothetical protein
VQLEPRYLVFTLRELMNVIEGHQALLVSGSIALFALRKSWNTRNSDFARKVKEELQNTLLRGVSGDDNETFKDALRRAEKPPGTALGYQSTVDQKEEKAEWFTEKAWEILGWDILTGGGNL